VWLRNRTAASSAAIAWTNSLAEREGEGLDTWIEKFNLKGHVFDSALLPDELIHPRLSNLARAIGGGIDAMIVAGFGAIQPHIEANRRPLARAKLEDASSIEPGFPYYLYTAEMTRSLAYGGMRDRLLV